MSVAFRRDGDDEHLEPKFEIPIPPGPNLVTERGLRLIREQVAKLEQQIAEQVGSDADAVTRLKRDLRYWQTREITAEVMQRPDGETVAFGAHVTFMMGGRERSFTIVGDDEADPATGLISFTAPLARALIGAQEGDLLPFNGKDDAIEVLTIAPGPDGDSD